MNEFELIGRLVQHLPTNESVVLGAGDDCAVLDLGLPDRFVLLKADAVVEGVHYEPGADPEKVGHKALGRSLSDVAAMAGTPLHALVTLGLPRDYAPAFVEGVYRGLNRLAARFGVAVVGGETTSNPGGVFISVTVLGTVSKSRCLRRSGAKVGDGIFVTGTLGGSIEGKHLDIEPRLAEAQWLAAQFDIHSMIDLSDGLAGDLPHLLKASGVGAELMESAIPVSRAARAVAGRATPPRKTALEAALTDGEDFELLFTVASKDAVPLLDGWKRRFPEIELSCVGKIVPGSQLLLRSKTEARPLEGHGYVHFAQS